MHVVHENSVHMQKQGKRCMQKKRILFDVCVREQQRSCAACQFKTA